VGSYGNRHRGLSRGPGGGILGALLARVLHITDVGLCRITDVVQCLLPSVPLVGTTGQDGNTGAPPAVIFLHEFHAKDVGFHLKYSL
jgi:hypothetical protein